MSHKTFESDNTGGTINRKRTEFSIINCVPAFSFPVGAYVYMDAHAHTHTNTRIVRVMKEILRKVVFYPHRYVTEANFIRLFRLVRPRSGENT